MRCVMLAVTICVLPGEYVWESEEEGEERERKRDRQGERERGRKGGREREIEGGERDYLLERRG